MLLGSGLTMDSPFIISQVQTSAKPNSMLLASFTLQTCVIPPCKLWPTASNHQSRAFSGMKCGDMDACINTKLDTFSQYILLI